jgi:hypothetical protein
MSLDKCASISKRNSLLGRLLAIACAAALVLVLMPRATADEHDKLTYVTFSSPVEVPGKVLPPGTYAFKLLDSSSNRNIVQIFDKDQKNLYATILGIPNYRLKAPDKTLIQFEERPSGSPEAIEGWFYPGDNYGLEFVYPHQRATELAKRTNHNVLSMSDEAGKTMNTSASSASDPGIKSMQNTDVTGVDPSGGPVAITVIVTSGPGN